jgi:hypothetical protein
VFDSRYALAWTPSITLRLAASASRMLVREAIYA